MRRICLTVVCILRIEAAFSAPGFLSHFPPKAVESLVSQGSFLSAEQHTLATPIPTPPSESELNGNPYVDRFAVPASVEKVYADSWKAVDPILKSHKVETTPEKDTPSNRPYGYPADWPYGHQTSRPNDSNKQLQNFPASQSPSNIYGLNPPELVSPDLLSGLNMYPYTMTPRIYLPEIYGQLFQPLLNSYALFPVYSEAQRAHEETHSDVSPTNLMHEAPSMASRLGDSLGSQMGSSLGSSLATDLNLLHGLTNSAAQNFFNVFNGQFHPPLPLPGTARQLSEAQSSRAELIALSTRPPVGTPIDPLSPLNHNSVSTASPTLQPAGVIWNEAIENLQNHTASLGLPSLSGFNATLPLLDAVGNGAGLPVLTGHTGNNLGNALGETLGNSIASTAELWKALLSSVGSGFMGAIAPSVGELASMFNQQQRRLEEAARFSQQKRMEKTASCAEVGVLYDSTMSLAFNDVPNPKTCTLICQTYSTPALITGDLDKCHSATELPCLWTSYSLTSHRCMLLFSLANQYYMESFVSEPVYCPGDKFVQTESQAAQSEKNGCDFASMQTKIILVSDAAKPPAPMASVSTQRIPSFPTFDNLDAQDGSVWKYNPDIPLKQRDQFEENVIYQIGYGFSNPLEGSNWGQGSNVKDWRGCAWLCHQNESCRFWTYHFDPLTYSSQLGACTLATNKDPKGEAVSRVQTISGSRLSEFPTDLFGNIVGEETQDSSHRQLFIPDSISRSWIPVQRNPPRRLSESGGPWLPSIVSHELLQAYGLQDSKYMTTTGTTRPEVSHSCRDRGYAYHVPTLSNSSSPMSLTVTAESLEDCEALCMSTPGCSAYQFVPRAVLRSSSTLQAIQPVPCLLLHSVAEKAFLSVPSMISAQVSSQGCDSRIKPKLPEVKAVVLKTRAIESQVANSTKFATFAEDDITCLDHKNDKHAFAAGVSVRGALMESAPNVLRGVDSPSQCYKACSSRPGCIAFTWGTWQGCYLLQTLEAFVADVPNQVVSGYADCEENSRKDLVSMGGQTSPSKTMDSRLLTGCGRAYKGLVYARGSIIANRTDIKSAQDCWSQCRNTADCFHTTFISLPATSHGGKVETTCLWFDQVGETQAVQARLGTSVESNCDVMGELAFEGKWAASRLLRPVNIPAVAGATAGVIGLLLGGGILWWRQKSVFERTVALPTGSEDSSNTSKSINAFGMSDSSLSMSLGALERGSPALQLDDFEKVEPNGEKSTGKRLRRYF